MAPEAAIVAGGLVVAALLLRNRRPPAAGSQHPVGSELDPHGFADDGVAVDTVEHGAYINGVYVESGSSAHWGVLSKAYVSALDRWQNGREQRAAGVVFASSNVLGGSPWALLAAPFVALAQFLLDPSNLDPPDEPVWPWVSSGIPYAPSLVGRRTDGGIIMHVPGPDGEPVDLQFSGEALLQLFPGANCLEHAYRSGMLCWRPFDEPTPFSEFLYRVCPWLPDYEVNYIRDSPEDFEDAQGQRFDWASLGNAFEFASNGGAMQLLVQARRYAAHAALHNDRTTWQASEVPNLVRLQPQTQTVLEGNTFGHWLGKTHFFDNGRVRTVHALAFFAREFGHPIIVPNFFGPLHPTDYARGDPYALPAPTFEEWRRWGSRLETLAWRERRDLISPAHRGFPGAWRIQ